MFYNDVSIRPPSNLNVVLLGYVLTFSAKSIFKLSIKQSDHTFQLHFWGHPASKIM